MYLPLQERGFDFTGPYEAAYALAHRLPVQVYDVPQLTVFSHQVLHLPAPSDFRWTPQTAALLTPLGLLPYPTAHLLWLLICQITLLMSFWLLARCLSSTIRTAPSHLAWLRSPQAVFLFLSCAAAWSEPITGGLRMGQSTPFLLLGCALLLYGEVFERPLLAGCGLGLAILVKLFPAVLLVYYLWRGRYRLLLGALALLVLLTVLTLPITGLEMYRAFALALQTYQGQPNAGPVNLSLYHALIVGTAALVLPGQPEPTSGLLVVFAQAVCLALFGVFLLKQDAPALLYHPAFQRAARWLLRRQENALPRLSTPVQKLPLFTTAWAICTLLLVEPIDWIFYYLLLLLPLCWLLAWQGWLAKASAFSRTRGASRFWLVALCACFLASLPLPFDTRTAAPMSATYVAGICIRPAAVLLLWCYFAWQTKRASPALQPLALSSTNGLS
jgi:hypothetical protein